MSYTIYEPVAGGVTIRRNCDQAEWGALSPAQREYSNDVDTSIRDYERAMSVAVSDGAIRNARAYLRAAFAGLEARLNLASK